MTGNRPLLRSLRLTLVVALALLPPALARAATLPVPSAAYPTIQAGVNAAVSGDTVLVADGTYMGDGNRDIDFNGKNITVASAGGAASTIIDCGGMASTDGSGNHRGFYIHSGETKVVISGFTVENGYEVSPSGLISEGNGGGICVKGSGVTIQGCIVSGNTARDESGGGIYYSDAASVTITSCQMINNAANRGGGVCSDNAAGTATIMNCAATGNTATSSGGGISNGKGVTTLSRCTITGNTVPNTFGGGVANFSGTTTLNDCVISNNGAQYEGGGVGNFNGMITLTGCTISGNTVQFNGGGVDNLTVNGTIRLTNCSITNNTAQSGGGGVYNESSNAYGTDASTGSIILANCTITGNKGGGVYISNSNGNIIGLANDILYGNDGGEVVNDARRMFTATITYSDIGGGHAGTGNINADPLFVNAASGDFRLKPGSPCLGAGTSAGAPPTDADGRARPSPPSLGAYEGTAIDAALTHVLWDRTDGTASL